MSPAVHHLRVVSNTAAGRNCARNSRQTARSRATETSVQMIFMPSEYRSDRSESPVAVGERWQTNHPIFSRTADGSRRQRSASKPWPVESDIAEIPAMSVAASHVNRMLIPTGSHYYLWGGRAVVTPDSQLTQRQPGCCGCDTITLGTDAIYNVECSHVRRLASDATQPVAHKANCSAT